MSAHSPGPWKWVGKHGNPVTDVLVDARGVTVAHTFTCASDWNTSDADRRLIEAAPALLALAEMVATEWCSERRLARKPCGDRACAPCVALTLITRIEGVK